MWKPWTGGRKLDVIKRYAIGESSFLFSVSRPRWETRAVFVAIQLLEASKDWGDISIHDAVYRPAYALTSSQGEHDVKGQRQ